MDSILTNNALESSSDIHLTVFMPCLNEATRVEGALNNIFSAAEETGTNIEVIVIDDGSTDTTSAIVRNYINENPLKKIHLETLTKNRGLGRNFIDAAFIGKGAYYRTVAGDNYEIPCSHVEIMKNLGKADIILPVYIDVKGRTYIRTIISKTYTLLVNLLSGNNIKYYNGFAVYRRTHVIRFAVESTGFGFQAELTTRLLGEGATFIEVKLPATAQPGSKALRIRNFISVCYSLFRILARRVSRSTSG